jgi:predicted ester cyclase
MTNSDDLARNKAVVRRFIDEVCIAGRNELIPELFDPEFRLHHERNRDYDRGGLDGARSWVAETRAAFPDQQAQIERMLAENDRVMLHLRITGTHRGSVYGVQATGRTVEFTATEIVRLREGRIAEIWAVSDQLGLLQRVGAVAPAGFADATGGPSGGIDER